MDSMIHSDACEYVGGQCYETNADAQGWEAGRYPTVVEFVHPTGEVEELVLGTVHYDVHGEVETLFYNSERGSAHDIDLEVALDAPGYCEEFWAGKGGEEFDRTVAAEIDHDAISEDCPGCQFAEMIEADQEFDGGEWSSAFEYGDGPDHSAECVARQEQESF